MGTENSTGICVVVRRRASLLRAQTTASRAIHNDAAGQELDDSRMRVLRLRAGAGKQA